MECRVNETYPCLVGEALASGLPAWLIRLSGCNLDCTYCDTRYACTEPGQTRDSEELAAEAAAAGLGRVLITGGEPLVQEAAFADLAARCLAAGQETLVETNGTLSLHFVPAAVQKIVDIKTPQARAGAQFLQANLEFLGPRDQLKLVLMGRSDYEWARSFLAALPVLPMAPENVLFSAAWGYLEPRVLAEWMLVDRLPYRFQIQMHKVLWGDKRGV